MNFTNLEIGAVLTVIGMGLVFAVLGLLALTIVVLVRLTDRAASRGDAQGGGLTAPAAPAQPPELGLEPDALAAIAMAVRLHQTVRRMQAAPAMRTHQPGTLPSRWLMSGRTRQNRNWLRRG